MNVSATIIHILNDHLGSSNSKEELSAKITRKLWVFKKPPTF